jgi:copper ion binding protein
MTQVTLEAPDISCDHCITSIEKAVTKLPGVRFVSGDPDGKQVVVEFDPGVADMAAIEAAMEEEGYPVKK